MEDYVRFTYIIKALTIHSRGNTTDLRKLLNHIIIVYNVFGNLATEVIFDKVDESMYGHVAALLVFLSRMPQQQFTTITGKTIRPWEIQVSETLIQDLQNETDRNG